MTARTLQRLLVGSLALNLFFVGMGAARWLRPAPELVSGESGVAAAPASPSGAERGAPEAAQIGESERSQGPPADLVLLRHIAQTMGGRDDPRVQAVLQSDRAEVRRLRGEIAEHRAQVTETLVAEPFDEAALRDALARLRESTSATAERASSAVLTLTSQMTPAERSRLQKRIERGLAQRGLQRGRGLHAPDRRTQAPGRGQQAPGRSAP